MILYKDVLKLFAQHIHDKKTFFNFAVCNSVCAQISRELKTEKDREFNTPLYTQLNFWFNRDPSLALPLVGFPKNIEIMKKYF